MQSNADTFYNNTRALLTHTRWTVYEFVALWFFSWLLTNESIYTRSFLVSYDLQKTLSLTDLFFPLLHYPAHTTSHLSLIICFGFGGQKQINHSGHQCHHQQHLSAAISRLLHAFTNTPQQK